jgi:hypothetical protein
MIGLHRPMQAEGNLNVPPEIRNLSKTQLYNSLSQTYLLPALESKGMCRTYLVGVFRAENYRLPLLEYKRLEAELTPIQQKKVNLANMAYIYRKLNALLAEMNLLPLGFPEFIIPEESWITKVARFVDRRNVMEFFESHIEGNALPRNMSERVHSSRMNTHQFLFGDNNLLQNKEVYETVKDISESHRRIISKRIDIEEAEHVLAQLRIKLTQEEASLKSSILRSSTTIMAIAQQNFNPDELYMEGNEGAQANRLQVVQINRLLKFIYCTDSVLDRGHEVAQLVDENAVRNRNV